MNQYLARYWFAVRDGKIGSPVRDLSQRLGRAFIFCACQRHTRACIFCVCQKAHTRSTGSRAPVQSLHYVACVWKVASWCVPGDPQVTLRLFGVKKLIVDAGSKENHGSNHEILGSPLRGALSRPTTSSRQAGETWQGRPTWPLSFTWITFWVLWMTPLPRKNAALSTKVMHPRQLSQTIPCISRTLVLW